MAKFTLANGVTSRILRVKLLNSSVTTGAGLTGLDHTSAGLIISTIANNEAAATVYTQAGSTIEAVGTLGTFAAPTATKCRFKAVDGTNHPGVYEIQLADARFAVSSATALLVSISGATNLAQCDFEIQLEKVNANLTHIEGSATIESVSLTNVLKRTIAALWGKCSGNAAGAGTIKFRDQADALDRISATYDSNKNRTGLTFNDG